MQPATAFFSLAVLGNMDPRIHHPAWYRAFKLITEEEYSAAIDREDTFCTPPSSRFVADDIIVTCNPSRWDASTAAAEKFAAVKNLATVLFDDVIPRSGVSAYGLNFNYSFQFEGNVGNAMARRLSSTELEIDWSKQDFVECKIVSNTGERRVTRHISTPNANTLVVANNYHYELPAVSIPSDMTEFKLGDLLSDHFQKDRELAMNISTNFAATFAVLKSVQG